ncbi:MAG: hypothetical protein AAFZ09_21000, partial [Pseudomonadota bacterium]
YAMHFPHHAWPAGRDKRMSPVHDKVKEMGGQMGPFGGWERALWFAEAGDDTSEEATQTWTRSGPWEPRVKAECEAVRDDVGVIAIPGFSRYRVQGLGAAAALDGLIAGFAMMAALIVAAALALPVAVAALLGLAERRSTPGLARWFWADSRQQLSGLSLALMALLLALAVNIGVGTMVGSFRATFTAWLEDRLAADIYLRAKDDAQAADVRAFFEAD